jgi:hypothetical protein
MDKIIKQVVDKFISRSNVGIKKYNTTLEENNTDDFLTHLQEELMDAVNYIEKLMDQKQELTKLVKNHQNDSELGMMVRKMITGKL